MGRNKAPREGQKMPWKETMFYRAKFHKLLHIALNKMLSILNKTRGHWVAHLSPDS